jgi:hypothetical protein
MIHWSRRNDVGVADQLNITRGEDSVVEYLVFSLYSLS